MFMVLVPLIVFEVTIFFLPKLSGLKNIRSQNREIIFQEYANKIIETCFSENHRPSCYDREIPKLMDEISMEDAFEVTKLVQEKDSEYWYCHVLGHNLSAKEAAKDPAKWQDVIARCPSGMCSNGCIHGAFQERFRSESLPDAEIAELKPELEGICEARPGWNPTGLEQATCYHALGHLNMYITGANIEKSTQLCQELAKKTEGRDYSQICFDGAFMQIFQPLEPEDFALVEGKQPKKEELATFCSQFTGVKRSSCWTEGWPLFFQEVKEPEGLVKFCSFLQSDPGQHRRCYEALLYVLTAQFNFDEEKISELCTGFPQERKGQCFANAASRMVETDARLIEKSVALCRLAEKLGVEQECYQELLVYSTYNFHSGSPEFFEICNALPDTWKTKCLAKER